MDGRLKCRARGRLAQCLLEQRDGAVGALELGKEDQSLGAQRADFRLGQQVGRDRPGARPLPGGVLRTSCSQRSAMTLVARVLRRQPERVLRELGGDGRRTAIGRQSRRIVEHGGDVAVRRIPRHREVTGAQERVVDDSGDPRVHALPLRPELLIEHRGQERMGEANHPVLALDHAASTAGSSASGATPARSNSDSEVGAHGRGERERLTRGLGQAGEPRAQQPFERLGDPERLQGVDVGLQNAGELQREERVPAGPLVDPQQRLAGEGRAEPVAQEPVQRAEAERSHAQPLHGLHTERRLERRRLRSFDDPPGEQQEHAAGVEPSERERERAR